MSLRYWPNMSEPHWHQVALIFTVLPLYKCVCQLSYKEQIIVIPCWYSLRIICECVLISFNCCLASYAGECQYKPGSIASCQRMNFGLPSTKCCPLPENELHVCTCECGCWHDCDFVTDVTLMVDTIKVTRNNQSELMSYIHLTMEWQNSWWK